MKKLIKKFRFRRIEIQLLLIALVYLSWNWGSLIPLTGDQKTYISIAMEMAHQGQWSIPYLFGEPNFLKPPLLYWLLLISWHLFGLNFFSTLLPSGIAVLATGWFLTKIHQLIAPRRKQRTYVALWFALAAGTFTYGHSAQMEIFLVLFYSAAWWLGLSFIKTKNPKWIYFSLAVVGALSWIKSPLYSALWSLSFFLFCWLDRQRWIWTNRHLYLSFVLGTLLGLSWFFIAYLNHPVLFWNEYILRETFHKSSNAPLWRMWYDFASFLLPSTLIWFGVFLLSFRKTTLSIRQKRFLWCWSLLPALFFSSFPYKTETYLFILTPAFALWIDWALTRSIQKFHIPYRLWMVAITSGIFLMGGYFLLAAVLSRAEWTHPWINTSLVVFGFLSGISLIRLKMRGFLLTQVVLFFVIKAAIFQISEKEMRPLRNYLEENQIESLAFLDPSKNIWNETGWISVALGQPIQRVYTQDQMVTLLEQGTTLILSEAQWEAIQPFLSQLENYPKFKWIRWQRRGQFPVKDLLLYGKDRIRNWHQRFERTFWVIQPKSLLSS